MKTNTTNSREISQTINDRLCDGTILIGYGKPGHGMNGKDADLDRVGQCLVTSLETVDPVGATEMRVDIHLRLYASICSPSCESVDIGTVRQFASKREKEFFREQYDIDVDSLDEDSDTPDDVLETLVEYYREQATHIVCGMDATPGDPFAFMWDGDEAWDGGIDVVLSVPLTVDEYEAVEDGDQKTLDEIAARIAKEIWDGNKGGTPERDKMKRFEEEVGLCNDLINKLSCYYQNN